MTAPKPITDQICTGCGCTFRRTVRAIQKYCSPTCRRKFWNKKCAGSSAKWHKGNPEAVMLRSAKHRAKRDDLPFNLEKSDIVIPKLCPVLGIELECNAGTGSAKQNSPSLDKIIPELGYVKGNVQVISNLANVMKHDATPEQMLRFAKWVIETYEKGE